MGRGRVPPVDSSGWEITDEVDLNPGRGCGHPAMRSSDPCNGGGRRGQNKLPQESCRLSQLGPGQRGTGRTLSACAAISSRRRLPFSSYCVPQDADLNLQYKPGPFALWSQLGLIIGSHKQKIFSAEERT